LLSCPWACTTNNTIQQTHSNDLQKKFLEQTIRTKQDETILTLSTFDYNICLIENHKLEEFYKDRQNFKYSNNRELNRYFNSLTITNYLNESNLSIIIMQFSKDSFVKYDTFAKYQIKQLNLSNDIRKNHEELIKNIKSMMKKDFLLQGVNKCLENSLMLIYKKTHHIIENKIKYYVINHMGKLTKNDLIKLLNMNKNKVLISVIEHNNNFYLIFESNTYESHQLTYHLADINKENYIDNELFVHEILGELYKKSEFSLKCIFSLEKILFLVLYNKTNKEEQDPELLI